jgi:uncharacterized phage protein gp47/JayE
LSVFLDSTGFKPKTLVELRQELEASYRAVWGSTVDLSPEGPLGQHIALMSKRDADLWEGAQEIYTSRDPDQATGEALDNIAADKGLARLPPTQARADGVICWFPLGTAVTLPAGSKIKAESAPTTYSLESDVYAPMGASTGHMGVRLKVDAGLAVGDPIGLTIDGNGLSGLISGSVESYIGGAFATSIESNIAGSTAAYKTINGVAYLEILFASMSSVSAATGFSRNTDSMQGMPGNFVSDVPGAASLPAYTLDTISTPVANWLGVSQTATGTDGTDTETDTALRLRIKRTMRTGTGTPDAIYNAIMRVPGVAYASVTTNPYLNVDSEGRPGHSLECVVQGGEKQAVATAIWKAAPAASLLHGSFAGSDIPTVIGADDLPHPVNFSVPVAKFAWVKVTVTSRNGEEPTPDDLTRAIQDAITSWGTENMGLGDNSVLQKYYGPIYTVPSIQSVTLQHALTDTEGASPSWSSANALAVAAKEYAVYSVDRVVVSV